MDTNEMVKQMVSLLDEKKGIDIKIIKISELTVIADYFIIVSGTSSVHVRSLADDLEDRMERSGVRPRSIEGKTTGWILLDYNSVVVHVFTPDQREYYNLERLWSDASYIDVDTVLDA